VFVFVMQREAQRSPQLAEALLLAEAGERDMARALLRQSAVVGVLRVEEPPRFAALEACATAPSFSPPEAWPGPGGRDAARAALAAALGAEVTSVPPGRLLALLGQALKWQQHTGALPPGEAFDLFRGAPPPLRATQDAPPMGAALRAGAGRGADAAPAQWR
jgi:WD40 repeat-containing protein SMU1